MARRVFLGACVTLSVAAIVATPVLVLAATHKQAAPIRCGTFAVTGAIIHVSVEQGRVRCPLARRILLRFWHGHGVYHQRALNVRSYTIVSGWRCPNLRAGLSECGHKRAVITGTYVGGKVGIE